MKHTLRKPCTDCPFRRESKPGWLGNCYEPREFIDAALSDYPLPRDNDWQTNGDFIPALPCHMTVDYEDPDWRAALADAEVCHGALQFAVNQGKLPRDPERSRLVGEADPNPDVFRYPHEFEEHHAIARERANLKGAKR